jgi:hypothetical protein
MPGILSNLAHSRYFGINQNRRGGVHLVRKGLLLPLGVACENR